MDYWLISASSACDDPALASMQQHFALREINQRDGYVSDGEAVTFFDNEFRASSILHWPNLLFEYNRSAGFTMRVAFHFTSASTFVSRLEMDYFRVSGNNCVYVYQTAP